MDRTGLQGVKVGDSLMLATGSRYRSDERVTVARIGRKYLYVASGGREMRGRFDRDSGLEDSRVGARQKLYTPEQYDELSQRGALFEGLRAAGIDVRHEVRSNMSTDTLRALLATVQMNEN
jgi:hypothetical protein